MSKIYLINDMDINTYLGGAELDDKSLIELLDQNITFLTCQQLNELTVSKDIFYIISNFTALTAQTKYMLIQYKNYVIYEKDFKLCKSRIPDTYPTPYPYLPISELCNIEFYENAKYVICITEYQKKIYDANLNVNTINISGVLFSDSELELIKLYLNEKKNNKAYIYYLKNHLQLSSNYATHNNIEYDMINKMNRKGFLKTISKYSTHIFISPITESCSRQCIENKIFNTKIICGNNVGVLNEPWYINLSGKQLFNYVKNEMRNNIKKTFENIIKELT